MNTAKSNRAQAYPAVESAQPELRVVEADPTAARRRRAADNWFIGALIIASCLFMAAFFKYVLNPAAESISTSSSGTTIGEGP